MAERSELDVEIRGKAEKFYAELRKMPGQTEAAARKSADALQKGLYVQAAKDAAGLGKANANLAKSYGDVGKKVAELAGGPFAKLGGVVFDLIPKMGTATSGLGSFGAAATVAGGALAVSVAVLGAASVALVKLAGAASEAEKRLIASGHAADIPASARRSVEEYDAATSRLRTSVDLLVVTFGSDAAAAVARLSIRLAEGAEWLASMADALHRASDAAGVFTRVLQAITTGGGSEALRVVAERHDDAAEAALRQAVAERELAMAQGRTVDAMLAAAEAEEARRRKSAEGGEKLLQDRARQDEAAASKAIAEAERVAEEEARILAERAVAHGEWLSQRERTEREWAEARAEREAETIATNNALIVQSAEDLNGALLDLLNRFYDAEDKLREDALQAEREAAENQKRIYAERTEFAVDTLQTTFSAAVEIAKNQEGLTRKQLRQVAELEKAVSIFDIGVNTASAIVKAFALFGPPPSPAGIAAAAAATAAGATQAAAVASQPMPSFFGGGRVEGASGEARATTLHGGEGVLNAGAMDSLGDAILGALNAGMAPLQALGAGGGGGDVVLDGERIGRLLARQARGGGPLGRAVSQRRPAAFVSPFGRR